MSKTKIVCPKCGAEFVIPATTHVSFGVVVGADSNLGTIYPEVVEQSDTKPKENSASNNPSEPKNIKAEAKLEALRKAGVNVDNLFSMKGVTSQEIIGRLENGQLTIVADDAPIFAAIIENGTVPNSQLFRRWVMAQVFHMLSTGNFTRALQRKGYSYQWKMLVDEMEAQAKMWSYGDQENFIQRNRYFNKRSIGLMADDYIARLLNHIEKLPRKKCKGVPYITLKGKDCFVVDIQTKLIQPLAVYRINSAKDPEDLHKFVMAFFARVKKTWLTYDIPMAAAFKDSYKGAGAYFTMRNMILFHGAKFRADNGRFLSQKQSLAILESKAEEYQTEGWRLFGVMKQLIEDSNIDIKAKMAEWRKK